MSEFDFSGAPLKPVIYSVSYSYGPPRIDWWLGYIFFKRHPELREQFTPDNLYSFNPFEGESADSVTDAAALEDIAPATVAEWVERVHEELADTQETYGSSCRSRLFRDKWVRWDDGLVSNVAIKPHDRESLELAEFLDEVWEEFGEKSRHLEREERERLRDPAWRTVWIPECMDYQIYEYDGLERVIVVPPWQEIARELARVAKGELDLHDYGISVLSRFIAAHPDGIISYELD